MDFRTLYVAAMALGCSGATIDPLEDASDDHRLGGGLDASDAGADVAVDAPQFGDSAPLAICYREYDASAPPFDCANEKDTHGNPLPYKFICPLDAGQYPSGTAGVTCIEELFLPNDRTLWCCGN